VDKINAFVTAALRKGLPGGLKACATERMSIATDQGVGRGSPTQIGNQAGQIAVAQVHAVDVYHGKVEARVHQQAGNRSGFDAWVGARGHAAACERISGKHRAAQRRKAVSADQGTEQ
jgi:hypothetical protein